ncbi:MAG: class I poly(R)-hydroxyalkanoic acid synthase [Proteobacteria bacterium]|nr:class I poly(R)-hydroxyalkanoic acid synthase [Pseudomonadota bacterium]
MAEVLRETWGGLAEGGAGLAGATDLEPPALPAAGDALHWAGVAARMQTMWAEFQAEQAMQAAEALARDPGRMLSLFDGWIRQLPALAPADPAQAMADGVAAWQNLLGQAAQGPDSAEAPAGIARRFAAPEWQDHPLFALLRQTYLMLAGQLTSAVERLDTVDGERKEQLRFATRALIEALSPANLPLTNPMVIERAVETRGESLIKGLEHLLGDLRRGQLTHSDPNAFTLGENLAASPGKVVAETPLYQLIQYSPATPTVLETPLVIFPPWINRFYILDLVPKKSFVKWAVDQGITVFMVSWKSADASMADLVWDDYIRAQIEAIDTVRARLKVPAVHTIGYCVAGTTLAATLAVLARRGEGHKVASATFFTAQVDFEAAGELKNFIDEPHLAMISQLGAGGVVDGRVLAATFNLLRGQDLIWNYVVNHYLLGQDYPAFDLLHWNGDVTNLPARWHGDYLRDLYRDNRLVVPDSLSADGTPIDLTRIETPCYIQAGREDHIAPAPSVWRLTRHLKGEWLFLLAGSGHIAGVVNPPAAGKYQYWTNPARVDSLEEFVAGAQENPGSWWPHWLAWLSAKAPAKVPARGKRAPGGKGDPVIEDAPGRYVKQR